jgi:hypothetical protein
MTSAILLPSMLARLFREHDRVREADLRLAADRATLRTACRHSLQQLATNRNLAICLGLGLAVGSLRRKPVDHRRFRHVRLLAALAFWLGRLRSAIKPARAESVEPDLNKSSRTE